MEERKMTREQYLKKLEEADLIKRLDKSVRISELRKRNQGEKV